jgi:hypothetical protein
MKRPRWLGSGESTEEKEADGDTAAERPVRRHARMALSARVARDEPATGSKEPEAGKPKRGASKQSARPKPPRAEKPEIQARPKRARAEQKREAKRDELNRPRRRPDEERRSKRRKPTGRKALGRKPLGRRVRTGVAASARALQRGATETRKQITTAAPKLGRRILAGLGAVFAIFFEVLGFILNVAIAVGSRIARPIGRVLAQLRRYVDAASRIATPTLVLALVVAAAAVLLALSQYADYRSISIGNDAYSGVQNVAPAPETARLPTGDPNSYIFVPIGIVCLLLLGGALTGRWRLCRLIALAGVAAIVVAVVVDRPAGLDTGDAALAFDGVRATLLGGFYAQIAAGVLLIGSSFLLARELRPAAAAEHASARGRMRRARRRAIPPPTDAGGVRT